MCGIGGILSLNGAPVDAGDLRRIADAIRHRGPDGEGSWISEDRRTGLVHRRLAILDTSERGTQPMFSGDGRYVIVYNGEIYNFIELREQLIVLGSRFSSDSDTEVILEAWRHWGEAMLHRFNGMWALAIHDLQTRSVFFARDRFGIKPLLYTVDAGRLAFASEMRALTVLPWLDKRLDADIVARLLFDPFSIEGSDRTIHANIRRLPAGHLAIVDNHGAMTVRRWWTTADHLVDVPASEVDQADGFRKLFIDAVRLRLRSDVRVGTCLSGGFDSTAVTCVMSHVAADQGNHVREASDWRHAFVASFPGQDHDETPEARVAAAYARVEPHFLEISDADALAEIERVLIDFDDIYIQLPTAPWQIYRELRRASTVVSLDGHGADELMGGYRQQGQNFSFLLRNLIAMAGSRSKTMARVIDSMKAAWLSRRGLNFLKHHRFSAPAAPVIDSDSDQLPAHWGSLNRRLYRMFHGTVLPTILRNFDRLSMAHGIEIRMPFMDWRLVAYTMSLPDEAKSDANYSKLVARRALEGLMPDSIRLARRKVGFNSPMPSWLGGPLKEWVAELLGPADAEFDAIVDSVALRKKINRLTNTKGWDWESAGRLWPYIHLKWYLARLKVTA